MSKIVFIILGLVLLIACKNDKQSQSDSELNEISSPETLKEERAQTSALSPYELLQGNWVNTLDTSSVLAINDYTVENRYEGEASRELVPFSLETQCPDENTTQESDSNTNYIVIGAGISECYEIVALTPTHLELVLIGSNITLSFTKE